jgi:FkbM family methyltransferase
MRGAETSLRRAVRRLHRSPLYKLFDPGPGRFAIRYLLRIGGSGRRVRTRLFFGDWMEVVLPEVISEAVYTYGMFDEIVSWLSVAVVRPGDLILDVGAHFGYFTLLFAHLVGDRGHVVAFEPTPSTFDVLCRNVADRANVLAVNAAAGSGAGEATIRDYGLRYCAWNTLGAQPRMSANHMCQSSPVVKVMRLDDYIARARLAPDVIKIDAETFEREVVVGLEHTLAERRPAVIMEGGSDESLAAAHALITAGYEPWVSVGLGHLEKARQSLAETNRRHKDVLFLHPRRRPSGFPPP